MVEEFNDCLRDAELQDLDIMGHQFTWKRGRNTNQWTKIRLDRVLANAAWLNQFPVTKVYNLEGSPSDHSPLLTVPEIKRLHKKASSFKFENAWLTEPIYGHIVRESWEEESEDNVVCKIKNCAKNLQCWGKDITGCFNKRIKECK